MQLSQYSKYIKYLTIIPFIVGTLIFVEILLPLKTEKTKVVSKEIEQRRKSGTTYKIKFEKLQDEFTRQIYSNVNEGDEVIVDYTPLNKQIRKVTSIRRNKRYSNSTNEKYFDYGFGVVFILLTIVSFTINIQLTNKQYLVILFIILLSIVQAMKWLV